MDQSGAMAKEKEGTRERKRRRGVYCIAVTRKGKGEEAKGHSTRRNIKRMQKEIGNKKKRTEDGDSCRRPGQGKCRRGRSAKGPSAGMANPTNQIRSSFSAKKVMALLTNSTGSTDSRPRRLAREQAEQS